MTCCLIFLMSFQIAPQNYHEYTGAALFFLVIAHNILNYKWYAGLFKSKLSAIKILYILVNFSLMIIFMTTIFSGVIMSESFASLNIPDLISDARVIHLCCSYWCFALMGVHIGLHWGIMAAKIKINVIIKNLIAILISGYGLYLILKAGIFDYMFLKSIFAFLDYELPAVIVIIQNVFMLSFYVMAGFNFVRFLSVKDRKKFLPVVIFLSAIILGLILNYFV